MIESDEQHILGAWAQQHLVFESHSHQVIELDRIKRIRDVHVRTSTQSFGQACTENQFSAYHTAQVTVSVIAQTKVLFRVKGDVLIIRPEQQE